MENEYSDCPVCGRPLITPDGIKWCTNCALTREKHLDQINSAVHDLGLSTIDEITNATGIEKDTIIKIVRETPSLSRDIITGEPCINCNEVMAVKGSKYCFECRLDLYYSLNQAADSLVEKVENFHSTSETSSISSLRNSLQEKRLRAGSSRFNPTPATSRRF